LQQYIVLQPKTPKRQCLVCGLEVGYNRLKENF
jgi:hypothetical protein